MKIIISVSEFYIHVVHVYVQAAWAPQVHRLQVVARSRNASMSALTH